MPRLRHVLLAWVVLVCTAASAAVVINEIHHTPDVKQERVEFVELLNDGVAAVDLGGWEFRSGIQYRFPSGTSLGAGAYLVIAEDPAALAAKFPGTQAVGPWTGGLSGEGEALELVDANGVTRDTVDYRLGFPWPTVGDAPGYSIELLNPSLDNAVGGNWRASVVIDPSRVPVTLVQSRSAWRYRKGTAEASVPSDAWRTASYDDSSWATGTLPIGYDPAVGFGTPLDDMRVNGVSKYITIYLRKRFQLAHAADLRRLRLEALYDDGFKLWINGQLVLSQNMPGGEVAFTDDALTTRESNNYEPFDIDVLPGILRDGENVLCVQLANGNNGDSSDCFFDCQLRTAPDPGVKGPTPGRTNVVFAAVAPPAVRQVSHSPQAPQPGDPVVVSARVTDPDGVQSVTLELQRVEPGAYVPINDPAYATGWEPIPMVPQGGDGVYAAEVPRGVQLHRRLVRYRIRAVDRTGASVTVPYAEEPQPNFAYFVYGGVPAWTGSVRPGVEGGAGAPFTVGATEMNRLPVVHLLARRKDVEDCTWRDRTHGDEYFWPGTIVFDGEVYDHIRMRPRGGVWRYAMGKNMWKFDFNRGHDFAMRDNHGRKYRTAWTKLNLGACIQQGDFLHRGEQGLFESVGFRLFQLAGVPAVNSTFIQFRVVDEAAESSRDSQYDGDFWGLYLALEQPDGRFLDEHGLPDGNFYKMESGFGDPNNLGPAGPVDASDLRAFLGAYGGTNYQQLATSWWRTNLDLAPYYSYQAVVQAIHHYDIGDGKNYFFYHNPEDGRWTTVPWDLDLTWADNMYRAGQSGIGPNGGGEPFKLRVLSEFKAEAQHPQLQREFRNRVREFRDLLWNTDEAFRLIDEMAALVRGTNVPGILDADRAQWDYNPVMTNTALVNTSKAGHGRYYKAGVGSKDFAGMVRLMKDYVVYRASDASYSLDTISAEPDRPSRPTLTYTGPPGHPANRLSFQVSGFQGSAFASVRFRLAEFTPSGGLAADTDEPWRYEIEPVWDSGELGTERTTMAFPAGVARPGRSYRARVRHMDQSGRASNWSEPVEFVAAEADVAGGIVANLKLSELMYHPVDGGFEFIELFNAGDAGDLDLSGVRFSQGIDYVFPTGANLASHGHAVLVGTPATNFPAFRAHHGLPPNFPLFGPFAGSLDNGGETLTLKTGAGGSTVFSFTWDDTPPWPLSADGAGHSLVALDSSYEQQSTAEIDRVSNWVASALTGGSPGRTDPAAAGMRLVPRVTAGGVFEMTVQTVEGTSYRVETSTDLDQWSTLVRGIGGRTFVIESPGGSGSRYVRAVRE